MADIATPRSESRRTLRPQFDNEEGDEENIRPYLDELDDQFRDAQVSSPTDVTAVKQRYFANARRLDARVRIDSCLKYLFVLNGHNFRNWNLNKMNDC